MHNLISSGRSLPHQLAKTIFFDRGRQFVDRLQWDLCVTPKGYEVDEYDDDLSQYLIVHCNNRHMGSCRVRPTTSSTMIMDHFLPHFPEAADFMHMQKGRIFELTRFCRAPRISVKDSKVMLENLARLLDEYRDSKRLTGFVAVVFPQVARFLDTIGVRYLILSKSVLNNNTAYMICITHCVKVSSDMIAVDGSYQEFGNPKQLVA